MCSSISTAVRCSLAEELEPVTLRYSYCGSITKSSPKVITFKADVKIVSMILAASIACQGSRLGTNSRQERVFGPMTPEQQHAGALTWIQGGNKDECCVEKRRN